jgi:hypothetical protein
LVGKIGSLGPGNARSKSASSLEGGKVLKHLPIREMVFAVAIIVLLVVLYVGSYAALVTREFDPFQTHECRKERHCLPKGKRMPSASAVATRKQASTKSRRPIQ